MLKRKISGGGATSYQHPVITIAPIMGDISYPLLEFLPANIIGLPGWVAIGFLWSFIGVYIYVLLLAWMIIYILVLTTPLSLLSLLRVGNSTGALLPNFEW